MSDLARGVAALRTRLVREGWIDWKGNLRSYAPDDIRALYESIVEFES